MNSYPSIRLLIGGQWRTAADTRPVFNPATEEHVGQVPLATASDLDDALTAANEGLRVWRRTSPQARAQVLLQAARLLRERADAIAFSTVLEQGKPLAAARKEVHRSADILEWDANEGRRLYGRIVPIDDTTECAVRREPVGVVAAFSPWNAPVGSPMRKIAAALASGCSIVLKPAEETPAGALHIAAALTDAGLPPGVLNLVYGHPAEISSRLIADPSVRLVTFTGSVRIGRELAAQAGMHLKPSIMELGGHAPVLICRDADAASAGRQAAMAKMHNCGQICVSPTRFFVEEPVFDIFLTAFQEAAAAVRIGNGLDAQTQMGPLANARRRDEVAMLVDDARAQGARVATGGQRVEGPGHFYPLTVLSHVPDSARVMSEEPFGPLAIVNPIAHLEEGIRRANALPLGLAAYAFTRDATTVATLSARVETGNLGINNFTASVAETPFGGIKDSGYGREGGAESLDAFTTIKSVIHTTT